MIASLFALAEYSEQNRDRFSAVGTDVACTWTQSRKESAPVEVEHLDYRRKHKDTPITPRPTAQSFQPIVLSREEDAALE